jgi:hypothetical protein
MAGFATPTPKTSCGTNARNSLALIDTNFFPDFRATLATRVTNAIRPGPFPGHGSETFSTDRP